MKPPNTSGLGLILIGPIPLRLLVCIVFLFSARAQADTGVQAWAQRYNGLGAVAVAVDGNGNVLVVGNSYDSNSNLDYVTIKYSGAGLPLWTNRYNGPGIGNDHIQALTVDDNGGVVVTGRSAGGENNYFDFDFCTLKYSTEGIALWTNRYGGAASASVAEAQAIAVDAGGSVFVTGVLRSPGSFQSYATIKYSGAGIALWTNLYNGGNGNDDAYALAVDGSSNVIVTGRSTAGGSYDYVTIKYSNAGTALWTNRYDGPGNWYDGAEAVAVDRNGNVIVTGRSNGGLTVDVATIKYSSNGLPLWTNRYNATGFSIEYADAVVCDGNGDVIITGSSQGDADYEYTTIKYSGAGVPLWTNRYNGPESGVDYAQAVAVDARNSVFVTGSSWNGSSLDYATLKYSSAGIPLWTNRYNGPANGDDQPLFKSCLAIGRDGAAYVTGTSASSTGLEFATVKYVSVPEIQPLVGADTTNMIITWTAVPDQPYQLQCNTNLSTTDWQVVTNIVANGSTVSVAVNTATSNPQRYYRVWAP